MSTKYNLGVLNCDICKKYQVDVTVPFDLSTAHKFEDHVSACSSLKRLNDMDDSLKTPEILDEIKKYEDILANE